MRCRNLLVVFLSACGVFLSLKAVVQAQNAVPRSTLCETGCLLPPSGLLGWWPGDGNANDIQLGSNGTVMNGASFTPGLVGQAFSFDGVDDFVDVPDTPALHAITTAVTVDAWINPQVPPSGGGWIFARRDPFVSEGVGMAIDGDGGLGTQLQTSTLSGFRSADRVIQFNGEWQHVALTVDTSIGEVRLYLNGNPLPLQVVAGSVSGRFADVSHLFIGQRQSSNTPEGEAGGSHYKGLIDEVGFYNRALSRTEIQAIFSVGRRGKCKPTEIGIRSE